MADDPDPNLEKVTTIRGSGQGYTIELEKTQAGLWVFSADTTAQLPELVAIPGPQSRIEARLPGFLVHTLVWETALWKWIALLLAAFALFVLFRLMVSFFDRYWEKWTVCSN